MAWTAVAQRDQVSKEVGSTGGTRNEIANVRFTRQAFSHNTLCKCVTRDRVQQREWRTMLELRWDTKRA